MILHNYLLEERDEWDPTPEEWLQISGMEAEAAEALAESEWAQEIANEDGRGNAQGEAKRQYLLTFLMENNWWEDNSESESENEDEEEEGSEL